MTATFDWDELTLDEVELIEELTGFSVDLLREQATPKGKMLKAMVVVVNRRTDPEFSFEDAGKINIKTVNEMTAGDEDDEDPPEAVR